MRDVHHDTPNHKEMNKTVLVIDDDETLNKALARGLRADGFGVVSALSAEEGADILARITVDAIVLDRMMTGMDGLTFLHHLRMGGDTTPVIMLTAMTGAENAITGLSSGANDYLAKPFQLRELILRLNNIIKANPITGKMPRGLTLVDDEFFVDTPDGSKLFALSGEEKKLLMHLSSPMGNIVPAAPMVAKRLRMKLNGVLSNLDIITVRGRGYKIIERITQDN